MGRLTTAAAFFTTSLFLIAAAGAPVGAEDGIESRHLEEIIGQISSPAEVAAALPLPVFGPCADQTPGCGNSAPICKGKYVGSSCGYNAACRSYCSNSAGIACICWPLGPGPDSARAFSQTMDLESVFLAELGCSDAEPAAPEE